MLEFVTMLSIVALVFCAATVFIALVAGGLFKATQALKGKTRKESI
jgi:hypothetical protein